LAAALKNTRGSLVYEFLTNNSLDNILFGTSTSRQPKRHYIYTTVISLQITNNFNKLNLQILLGSRSWAGD
jgi:hypothetical protein